MAMGEDANQSIEESPFIIAPYLLQIGEGIGGSLERVISIQTGAERVARNPKTRNIKKSVALSGRQKAVVYLFSKP